MNSLPENSGTPQPLTDYRVGPEFAATANHRPVSSDPWQALEDLMVVVEALCPRWPPRPITGPTDDLRL